MKAAQTNLSLITRHWVLILALSAITLILPTPSPAAENCAQLLSNRCETCHYLTRVCQKVDRERNKKSWFGGTASTWKRTIKNMVRQGAKLNKVEEDILVECLSQPSDELLNLCKLGK